jgi:hypothetical protein
MIFTTPKWRNWQTHQIQGLAWATTCRFKSCLRHHPYLNHPAEFVSDGRRKLTLSGTVRARREDGQRRDPKIDGRRV